MTTFRNEDLVLRVTPDYDPDVLRLDAYEGFLDALCGDREFQKQAIRDACRFLAGGEYTTTRQLAERNYSNNPVLRERYRSLEGMISALPFPDKLACSLDLATGTGKSWVMYGIARVLMAEGTVDRVLVLCPSLTIEAGLRSKFKNLSLDPRLLATIPLDRVLRVPEVTYSNSTTGPGDICVENIDATYEDVNSSVRDSFLGRGHTTLVLNDEAHHIYTPTAQTNVPVKKWKQFLDSEAFNFTRIVGVSGTCYRGDEYFSDVISRYSLRQAMDDGRVKLVHYVRKDDSANEAERFQKYLQAHRENQKRYGDLVKPISIIVTARIAAAETLADAFKAFLCKEQGLTPEDADKRVLIVTSKIAHRAAVAQLATLDRVMNPVEWVISVSMLTEGWDVHNVFQVIPHEKRAFDSKLLIAQVLGRGLRLPEGMTQPGLRVFNHASWSAQIASLVREVLEEERRIRAHPLSTGDRTKYHFLVHNLTYETVSTTTELASREDQVNLFTRGYVQLETQAQDLDRETLYVAATTDQQSIMHTPVHVTEYSVDEVVQNMYGKLRAVDLESDTRYARDYPRVKLREVVMASLANIEEKRPVVTEPNVQRLLRAMGNIRREVARTVRVELKPLEPQEVSTKDLPYRSIALSSLMKEATVFYGSESLQVGEEADRASLADIVDDDSSFPKRAARLVRNKYFFKTPVNVVLTTHQPERDFVARLVDKDVAALLDAWVKSTDTGFYDISYSWRRGDHTKQGRFNPDFFIKLKGGMDVLVVELKEDGDTSDENRAKFKFASEHFARLNDRQNQVKYHMKFLSPGRYDEFFSAVKTGKAVTFVSALQASLVS